MQQTAHAIGAPPMIPGRFAEGNALRTVAFVCGLLISAVGAVGILAPPSLGWIAQKFVTSGAFAFYGIATIRIAFGLLLIWAAPASHAPKALRILGYVIVILGITTALTTLVAIGPAQDSIEWWLPQGFGVFRLTAVLILALGGFIAWACAPARRAA